MKKAYKAELRLLKENIIIWVQQHTELIDCIILVKKPNGSLRLWLDPKDRNNSIKLNKYYSIMIDDSPQELTTKYVTLAEIPRADTDGKPRKLQYSNDIFQHPVEDI